MSRHLSGRDKQTPRSVFHSQEGGCTPGTKNRGSWHNRPLSWATSDAKNKWDLHGSSETSRLVN